MLLASNHPASITDALILATTVPRRVSFVGTVRLFRLAPIGWLLRRCGIIPVNRVKDDPRAMRSVMETFEACFRVLEQGEAIGIFPEGITYDDDQLKPIKSGVARMALDLEHRHQGRLGLRIVPVGLTYSAKERYRSEVLVHFGEPLRVADCLEGYEQHRKESIQRLVAEVEHRLQALILHLPEVEDRHVLEAVKRLYLDQLRLGRRVVQQPLTPRAEELVLSQTIAQVIGYFHQQAPARHAAFVARLNAYERRLRRLRLSDEDVALFGGARGWGLRVVLWAAIACLGFPVALYGGLHRFAPAAVVEWVSRRTTVPETRKAQTSIASILGGVVAFGLFYLLYVTGMHAWLGWPVSLYYGLSLPLTGLAAHAYRRETARMAGSVRATWVLFRAPWVRRGLLRRRQELLAEIASARQEYWKTNAPQPGPPGRRT